MQKLPFCFPFGQPLQVVRQANCSPKKAFVLGVYASAVHARWIGPDGRDVIKALAVASEPQIFWRGDGADLIISRISVPPQAGRLVPAEPQFNGPSGVALDELFLKPLCLTREQAWLCDLVPHSCMNPGQQSALERAYLPRAQAMGLPVPSIPPVPTCLADATRRQSILNEFLESQAETLILLGDQPIRWFLSSFDSRWQRLRDFDSYGKRHEVVICGRRVQILPLAHPRQVARLGQSSLGWYERHTRWINSISHQPNR